MFLSNKKIISLLILALGTFWVYLNIFCSQFYIFSQGVFEPSLFLKGFVLFRDIMWNRAGFELHLIAGFYKLFGVSPLNFQIFIFLCQSIIGIIVFLLLYKKSFKLAVSSYILYSLFAYLIYGTIDESAEILIGLFVFLVFYFFWQFIEKKNLKFLFFAGIATGFAIITKQTAAFTILSTLILLSIFSRKNIIKKSSYYLFGAAIPVLIYAAYFTINNGLYDLYFNTIYAILGPYRQTAPLWGLNEGLKIMGLHLAAIFSFIFLNTKKIIPQPVKIALVIYTLGLFPTLLPTYWSYRLISALPIFSVMIAILLARVYPSFKQFKSNVMKVIVLIGFSMFLIQLGTYLNQSLRYIIDNGYHPQSYILDGYSENEEKVANWLKTNTTRQERIFNMATGFVLYFSDRIPQHKFEQSMYFGFYPLSQYYDTITRNPARVVVLDTNLPGEWPLLKDWEYLKFLKSHYVLADTFGQYEIYTLKSL